MSNLSDLLPSGGGSKSAEFVASGTLPNGTPIILNSNGTVTAVAGVIGGVGTKSTFSTGAISSSKPIASVFDSNLNKILIFYRDSGNSNKGMGVVASINGSAMTVGTPVVFESNAADKITAVFDTNSNKAVIAWHENGVTDDFRSVVATASGTTMSFGSVYTLAGFGIYYVTMCFDSNVNKVVLSYRDVGNQQGSSRVGTISGTSISYAGESNFTSNAGGGFWSTFDTTSNRIIIVYLDASNSYYATINSGSVSGTSVNWATETVFNSANTSSAMRCIYDPSSNRTVLVYTYGNQYGTAKAALMTGTSFTFGSATVFSAVNTYTNDLVVDTNANQLILSYSTASGNFIMYFTVSGLVFTFGSTAAFITSARSLNVSAVFDTNSNLPVISYSDPLLSGLGSVVTIAPTNTNLTTTNFVGMPDAAYASGATATVVAKGGVSLNQTSLTIGTTYFVQADGTLGTSAGTPSVEAGRAISATSILLKGK